MLTTLLLMAVTLVSNIAVTADATGTGNQSHLVYASNQQRWWLFYFDSLTATTVKTMVSSSNDLTTATWSAGTTSGAFAGSVALTSNDRRMLAVLAFANGSTDVFHVQVQVWPNGGNNTCQHARATNSGAASLSWGSFSDVNGQQNTGSTLAQFRGNALGRDTNGKIHAGGMGIRGDSNTVCSISTNADTSGSWTNGFSAGAATDTSAADQVNSYAFATLASGAMLVVYDKGDTPPNKTGLRSNKYTSGTNWPTTGSGVTGNGTTSVEMSEWCLCRVDATHIYAIRRATSATWDWRMHNGVSTWSTPTNSPPTFGGSGTPKSGAGLFSATDGTDLYLFAIDNASNGPIYYVKASAANATPTWGSWTQLEAAGSAARSSLSGYPVVSNSQIGVIYTEANGSNFDLKLSALQLSAPITPDSLAWRVPTRVEYEYLDSF